MVTKKPPIITFHIEKGGTAKSTTTYNFNGYASQVLNLRVLTIDCDKSMALTHAYEMSGEKSIYNIYSEGKTEIYHTTKNNIDIIIGSALFTDNYIDWSVYGNRILVLYSWIERNAEFLYSNYDIITIDTHNDNSQVTLNALAPSDIICAPSTADKISYGVCLELTEKVIPFVKQQARNPLTQEDYVFAKPLFLASRVTFNGNNVSTTIRYFLEALQSLDGFIGIIPERPIMLRTLLENKSIFEIYDEQPERTKSDKNKKRSLEKYINNLAVIFDKIITKANEVHSTRLT